MSTDDDVFSACIGKQTFPNAAVAQKSIRDRSVLVPYRCPYCGQFHVGHKIRPKKRVVKTGYAK
jgi:hypothetical protein